MDLDLVGFGDNQQTKEVEAKQNNSNSNVDPFDFLSTTPAQVKPTQQIVQNQPIFNIDLNQAPLKQQPIQSSNPPALNFFNTPQVQSQNTFTQPSFSSNIALSLNPPQPVKIP